MLGDKNISELIPSAEFNYDFFAKSHLKMPCEEAISVQLTDVHRVTVLDHLNLLFLPSLLPLSCSRSDIDRRQVKANVVAR